MCAVQTVVQPLLSFYGFVNSSFCIVPLKGSPVFHVKALELVVPVMLCPRIQWLAHETRELAVEGHNQPLCHKCVNKASPVERLYNVDDPGNRGIHSQWSHTHLL